MTAPTIVTAPASRPTRSRHTSAPNAPLKQPATPPRDPLADTDVEDWQSLSACAANNWPQYMTDRHDPEVFFPKRLEGGQCAPAKALCQDCPVRQQCLEVGLKEPSGVWGGLSEKERREAQKMARAGASLPTILAHFDGLTPKRRRKTSISRRTIVQAAGLTAVIIEDFVDKVGTVPTGATNAGSDLILDLQVRAMASISPSVEVEREALRRRNGL